MQNGLGKTLGRNGVSNHICCTRAANQQTHAGQRMSNQQHRDHWLNATPNKAMCNYKNMF